MSDLGAARGPASQEVSQVDSASLGEVASIALELLSLRTSPPPSGEAGEVTDEMLARVGERLAKLAISVDQQLVRTILTAALPTIKEPTDGK
jgi:hypothetical protein